MSQKKKINLGPLPEELDLSKYEETVTRWDRVIAVVVGGLMLLGILLYILLSNGGQSSATPDLQAEPSLPLSLDDSEADNQMLVSENASPLSELEKTELAQEEIVSVQKNVVSEPERKEAETKLNEPASLQSTVTNAQKSVDTEKGLVGLSGNMALEPSPESSESQVLPSAAQQKSLGIAKTEAKPSSALSTLLSNESYAQVGIKQPSIIQAVLTQELKNNEPVSALPLEVTLPESGITKIILFTEMKGLRGKTLFHDWYRNGERQARVKIPVTLRNQYSFSSKFINAQMTGEWQVKVVDEKSTNYVEAQFKVIGSR